MGTDRRSNPARLLGTAIGQGPWRSCTHCSFDLLIQETIRYGPLMSDAPPPIPAAPPPVPVVSVAKSSNGTKKAWLFGCGGCLVLVALLGAFGAAIFAFVFKALGESEAAQASLREAQASTVLIEEIGEPMALGWLVVGNVNVSNDSGDADIVVPIEGPKGTASVHTIGVREGGVWTMQEMTATVAGSGTTVDLLAD